jgi:hypothetical protein
MPAAVSAIPIWINHIVLNKAGLRSYAKSSTGSTGREVLGELPVPPVLVVLPVRPAPPVLPVPLVLVVRFKPVNSQTSKIKPLL